MADLPQEGELTKATKKCGKCEQCGKFYHQHSLFQHRRVHTEEKDFECNTCGKTFRCKHNLKAHKAVHSGEKPYKCTHCDKNFAQSGSLKRYIRGHTGAKPYKCSACDKCFGDLLKVVVTLKRAGLECFCHDVSQKK